MSGAVDRSGALEGEVIPAGESSQTGWAPTRVERRVLLEGRIRQLQTEVRAQLAVHAVQTAAAVRKECRETMHKVVREDLASHKTITDPLEKGFMERYDNDADDQLRDFSLGVQRVAMYAAEAVICQPFDVEEPEQALTFWELLLSRVFIDRQ